MVRALLLVALCVLVTLNLVVARYSVPINIGVIPLAPYIQGL